MNDLLHQATKAIREAEALLIGAGAGMGVDSGLPDFRGAQGFWRAYPPYEKLGLRFESIANPRWFAADPALAWGFYGQRQNLYRATQPHAGFQVLLRWAIERRGGAFVFTSNVDGHFQKAGYSPERIVEIHGAIDWLQCTGNCGRAIWPADGSSAVAIDETTMRARGPLPTCPDCGSLARPNILMFGDGQWDEERTAAQEQRLAAWLCEVEGLPLVIIECGAGTAIPTVRRFCERIAFSSSATLIRINLRDPDVPAGHVGLRMGALGALQAIHRYLNNDQGA